MFETIRRIRELGGIREARRQAVAEREAKGEKFELKKKLKTEKTLVALLGLLILARLVATMGGTPPNVRYVPLALGDQELYLEYAGTRGALHQGLKERPGLLLQGGMLFDLKTVQQVTITMKKVNFPLKVVTLDASFKVLEVQVCLPGQDDLSLKEPCRYFAEVHPDIQVQPGSQALEFRSTLNLPTQSLVQSGVF